MKHKWWSKFQYPPPSVQCGCVGGGGGGDINNRGGRHPISQSAAASLNIKPRATAPPRPRPAAALSMLCPWGRGETRSTHATQTSSFSDRAVQNILQIVHNILRRHRTYYTILKLTRHKDNFFSKDPESHISMINFCPNFRLTHSV